MKVVSSKSSSYPSSSWIIKRKLLLVTVTYETEYIVTFNIILVSEVHVSVLKVSNILKFD